MRNVTTEEIYKFIDDYRSNKIVKEGSDYMNNLEVGFGLLAWLIDYNVCKTKTFRDVIETTTEIDRIMEKGD